MICRCGHTNLYGKHIDDGPCGTYNCECDEFVMFVIHVAGFRPPTGKVSCIPISPLSLTHSKRLAEI